MSGFIRRGELHSRLHGGLLTALLMASGPTAIARGDDAPKRDSTPAKPAMPAPVINDKILAYARDQVGESVNDGECTGLVVEALKAAGARRYTPFGPDDDYVWGVLLTARAQIRPGDIIQFRDAVFRGRFSDVDENGNPIIRVYRTTFDHHSAIVEEVREKGKVLVILHQNAGNNDAPAAERKRVRRDVLRMADQRPGEGKVWFYRPVPRDEGELEPDLRRDAHAPDSPPDPPAQPKPGQANVSTP